MIIGGELILEINFNMQAHRELTIQIIKDMYFKNLERILEHIKYEDDIVFTPSDFDSVYLDDEDLNSLF